MVLWVLCQGHLPLQKAGHFHSTPSRKQHAIFGLNFIFENNTDASICAVYLQEYLRATNVVDEVLDLQ